jgi:hypothetical protein
MKCKRDASSSPEQDYVLSDNIEDEDLGMSPDPAPSTKRVRITATGQIPKSYTKDYVRSSPKIDTGLLVNPRPQQRPIPQNEISAESGIPNSASRKRHLVPDFDTKPVKRQKEDHTAEPEVSALIYEHKGRCENLDSLQTYPLESLPYQPWSVQRQSSTYERSNLKEEERRCEEPGQHSKVSFDMSPNSHHEDDNEVVPPIATSDTTINLDDEKNEFDINFTCWSAAWSSFILAHDAQALLEQMFPDDQDLGEWPGSKIYGVKDLMAFDTPFQRICWRY